MRGIWESWYGGMAAGWSSAFLVVVAARRVREGRWTRNMKISWAAGLLGVALGMAIGIGAS